MDVALATAAHLPNMDPDEMRLVPALAALGIAAKPIVWEHEFDWSSVRACVVRSTWGYYLAREEFLAWSERVAQKTKIFNAPEVLRWNTHKRYLAELEARGVRVVPTAFVDRRADLAEIARARGWCDVVVKPAVSAGAYGALRTDDPARAQAHLDAIVAKGDAMVQPYLPSVEARGEISLIFFDGALSHAVRKHAQLDGAGGREGSEPRVEPEDDEARFARAVLEAAPFRDLLYARVDIARDADGAPCLMELEVSEPSLFLAHGDAAARFAAAIARRL